MKSNTRVVGAALLAAATLLPGTGARASSHREAPFITENPKVDGTDFYMFASYEPGRAGYVTLIANYQPLQDPFGGPNYFTLDPDALYEIHVDNDGDAKEDLTFQFQFDEVLRDGGLALEIGAAGATESIPVPFVAVGPVRDVDADTINLEESYTLQVVSGDRRTGTAKAITMVSDPSARFTKPLDNIGTKTIPDYETYAMQALVDVDVPGCTPPEGTSPRVFVGQRKDGFGANIGQIFDLVNFDFDPATPQANPTGAANQGLDDLANQNVTTLALEIPASCLTGGDGNTVIGAWTTASMRQARVLNPTPTFEKPAREGGPWAQVSRLGMPLVNELVIGLPDKNGWNASEPVGDAQFLKYVTNPSVPEILELLFGASGVTAPDVFPRADLVAVFITGIAGFNQTATPGEMLRLDTAIAPVAAAEQNRLGALACFSEGVYDASNEGCDPAGFPNGRRPGDDVVDIELRVLEGVLLPTADAPAGQLPLTDGALVAPSQFKGAFPYLTTPIAGSPDKPWLNERERLGQAGAP